MYAIRSYYANGGEVQLFDKHMERFRKGLNILKIPLCDIYTNDYIKQVIKGVLHSYNFV